MFGFIVARIWWAQTLRAAWSSYDWRAVGQRTPAYRTSVQTSSQRTGPAGHTIPAKTAPNARRWPRWQCAIGVADSGGQQSPPLSAPPRYGLRGCSWARPHRQRLGASPCRVPLRRLSHALDSARSLSCYFRLCCAYAYTASPRNSTIRGWYAL